MRIDWLNLAPALGREAATKATIKQPIAIENRAVQSNTSFSLS
jgi:hypothetical protein